MKKFFSTLAGCILSIVILLAAQIIATGLGEILVSMTLPAYVCGLISAILYVILTYLGLKLLLVKLFKLDLPELGIKKFRLKPVWCVTAVLLPVLVVTAFLCMDGKWSVLQEDTATKATVIVTGIALYSMAAGIVEELAFRCVIMGIIRKNYNIKSAVIIPSVLFGLMHIIGNDLDFVSILQLVVAGTMVGIMFSLILYQSGNFWNNALVHAFWNMSTLGLLHIGTAPYNSAIYTYVLKSKNIFITGGDFGIESSVVSIAGYVAVSIIAFLMIKKKK